MRTISISTSGNCNFQYVTGLAYHTHTPHLAMAKILTTPEDSFGKRSAIPKPPVFRNPTCGMYLFAQESDGKTEDNPYGPNFKSLIEREKLGTVTEHRAANPMHRLRIGVLYVWIIDPAACKSWWDKNVMEPWNVAQKLEGTISAEFNKLKASLR